MMGIATWWSSLFVPPLSQASFEQAMAEQTAAITQVIADAIREGDGEVVVAVQAGNAEVVAAISEMTRQMSELSDDIRTLLAERPGYDSPSDVQN